VKIAVIEGKKMVKIIQLLQHQVVNVGFAVDVPGGLVVPVIRDTKALISRARANSSCQLTDSQFSWT
jgi:pyruvate/2-oxoglutarate dehydrogenase complex dihydrolipoamide acyltransferase (E2) component